MKRIANLKNAPFSPLFIGETVVTDTYRSVVNATMSFSPLFIGETVVTWEGGLKGYLKFTFSPLFIGETVVTLTDTANS